jgi:hypothetical protein
VINLRKIWYTKAKLYFVLKLRGLSVGDLARKVDQPAYQLHNYINGRSRCPEKIIDDICRELDVSPEWLITTEAVTMEPPPYNKKSIKRQKTIGIWYSIEQDQFHIEPLLKGLKRDRKGLISGLPLQYRLLALANTDEEAYEIMDDIKADIRQRKRRIK